MTCETFIDRLSAWLDGELPPGEQADLERHLDRCHECRQEAKAFRERHKELQRAFAPRRAAAAALAERVTRELIADSRSTVPVDLSVKVSAVEASPRSPSVNLRTESPAIDATQSPGGRGWVSHLLALAAGFALAIPVLRSFPRDEAPFDARRAESRLETAETITASPGPDSPATESPEFVPPVGQVTLAMGKVDVVSNAGMFTCPNDRVTEITPGCSVVTDDSGRCEVTTTSGAEIQLDVQSEMRLEGESRASFSRGKLNCATQPSRTMTVVADQVTVEAENAEFEIERESSRIALTVFSGSAKVLDGRQEHILQEGQRADLENGAVTGISTIYDALLRASWTHELLFKRAPGDESLRRRLDAILAQIGNAKMSHLYEEEIYRLGDVTVLPLIRFVASPESRGDLEKRRRAARFVGDLASTRHLPDVIELLADDDEIVRYDAAMALWRLAGDTRGLTPEEWKTAAPETRAAVLDAWRTWERNRHAPVELRRGIPNTYFKKT